MLDKTQQEKTLLETQIQKLKEDISTEIKERQELEERLKLLEDPAAREKEVEDFYIKTYLSKLAQFDKMLSKMTSLKEKLDSAK
jgi:hypothetical protein